MKFLYTLFCLLLCSISLFSQLTWEHTNGPFGGRGGEILSNDEYAFYPDRYFLYRTSDGINWEQLSISGIAPMALNGSTIVAQQWETDTYFYETPVNWKISHDNGVNWSAITNPPVPNYASKVVLCSHGIYVPYGLNLVIYRSQDEGMTWDSIIPPTTIGKNLWAFEDRLYLHGGSNDLWRTDENGENWEQIPCPISNFDNISNVLVHSPHILMSAVANLWHSHDDGQTWDSIIAVSPNQFDELLLMGNAVYATGYLTGLAKSTDFGATWASIPIGDYQNIISKLAQAGGKLLGSISNIGVVRWDESSQSLIETNQGIASASVYQLENGDDEIWAACGNGLFRYDIQQESWSPNSYLPSSIYSSYEFVKTNGNGLVCASRWLGNGLFLSNDSGSAWDSISCETISGSESHIKSLDIIDDAIFVNLITSDTYRSMDHGLTWLQINTPVYGDFFKFNNMLIGTDGSEIFTSSDLGVTWNPIATMPFDNVYKLYPAEDKLVAVNRIHTVNQSFNQINVSTDGINWIVAHDGLPVDDFGDSPNSGLEGKYFKYQGRYFAYDKQYGLYSSNNDCQSWFPVYNIKYQDIIIAGDKFYSAGYSGGVIRTTIPTNLYGEIAEGTIFKDDNNNGLQDGSETTIPNIRVGIDEPGAWYPFYFTTTDENGEYSLGFTPNSQDTLRAMVSADIVQSINPPYYLANTGTEKDFGIHLTPGIHDLSIIGNTNTRPRPGFEYWFYTQIDNIGSENEPTTVSLKLDNYLTYLSATPPPSSIVGDSLTWDIGTTPVFNGHEIVVKTEVPANVALGTLVENTWRVQTTNNDIDLSNNVTVQMDTVVGSFDPNDKLVEPALGLTAAEIMEGKDLHYTIRFQNTGTFPAERVRIADLLDTALYLPSLRLVAASHPVTSFQLKPGGLLEVIFDNIQLPDSISDEPGSHGFVSFAIQRNKAFNKNEPVRNTGAIYFDFNAPIYTNEVTFTVNEDTNSTATNERPRQKPGELLVFPNPTVGGFTVSSKGKLSGQGSLCLLNAMGQIVVKQKVGNLGNPIQVNWDELPAGIYFIKLKGTDGFMSGRVVVQLSH